MRELEPGQVTSRANNSPHNQASYQDIKRSIHFLVLASAPSFFVVALE